MEEVYKRDDGNGFATEFRGIRDVSKLIVHNTSMRFPKYLVAFYERNGFKIPKNIEIV